MVLVWGFNASRSRIFTHCGIWQVIEIKKYLLFSFFQFLESDCRLAQHVYPNWSVSNHSWSACV